MTRGRSGRWTVLGCLIALAAPVSVPAQGLAAVATKEKQRQAKAKAEGGPAKVYTDGASSSSEPQGSPTAKETPRGSFTPPGEKAQGADSKAAPRTKTGPLDGDRRQFRDVTAVVYMTSWCQYCRKTLAYLGRQANVRVITYDIEADKARKAEMDRKVGPKAGVPLVDIEGTLISGFSESMMAEAIRLARQ